MRTLDIQQKAFLEILAIFVLPIVLLYVGAIPLGLRFYLLMLLGVVLVGIMVREKWGWREMGIRMPTMKSILLYFFATILGAMALFYYREETGIAMNLAALSNRWFLMTFIPVSMFQEIAYRGFLMPMLRKVFDTRMTIVLVNASLFTVLHIIYPDPLIVLPLAFVSGLFFTTLYMLSENLLLVGIVHAILNFIAIVCGFFVIS